jgi:hypothetical protein
LELKNFCHSDWEEDPKTRLSVAGLIVYLLEVRICWRSKAQSSMTLSSTEAEYIDIHEATKEIKFNYYLLKDIHFKVIYRFSCRLTTLAQFSCHQLVLEQGMWKLVITLTEKSLKIVLFELTFLLIGKWL